MGQQRNTGGRRRRVNPLADAHLCADERYYRTLAEPDMRHGMTQRMRDLMAQGGPLLAAICALVIVGALTLASPARTRFAALLAPFQARFAVTMPTIAYALVVAVPLFVILAIMSLWARADRARERQTRATLATKLRLAQSYRRYLTELARLTEPLAWSQPAAADAHTDATADAEPGRAVLVALSVRHEAQWDEAELAPLGGDEGAYYSAYPSAGSPTRPLGATRPLTTRYRLAGNVEAINGSQRPALTVESVGQALASATSGAIILCGNEGAGKTTMMRYVAHAQALAQLRRTRPGGRLPLYADLGWLDEGWPLSGDAAGPLADPAAVEAALAKLVERIGGIPSADARDLAHVLVTEPALLLLDELDTLPSERRERVAASLAAFLGERTRLETARGAASGDAWSAQVVLGSRAYEAPLSDGAASARFQRWRLEPLAYPMGRLALLRGALDRRPAGAALQAESDAASDTSRDDDAAARLLRALATPQTERWLMQPLALTLAALAAAGHISATSDMDAPDAAPARSRTDLCRAATAKLLREHLPEWDVSERRALTRMAEELALWLQIAGRRAFIPGSPELDQWLRQLPETALVLARTGGDSPSQTLATLSGLCERGLGGRAGFSLVTLHAFLAGCALARRVAGELSSPHTLAALTPDALMPDAGASGARLPKPLTPDAPTPEVALSADVLVSSAALASDDPQTALGLAWTNRTSARWGDTLLFMCGALCGAADASAGASDTSDTTGADDIQRRDIALAWLRALLDQRDLPESLEALEPLGLLLAAASLPELRGDPSGTLVAAPIATRLYESLRQSEGALSHTALTQRYQACVAVMADPAGRETLLDLLTAQLLSEHERSVRQAAQTLGAIGQAGAQVAPLLIDLLRSTTEGQRAAVAMALGALGPAAGAEAVPALVDALSDQSRVAHVAVVEALGALVSEPDEALIHRLLTLLTDRSSELRAAAALALGTMGASGVQVAEALRQALRDRVATVQESAVYALGKVDTSGSQIPILIQALTTTSWNDRAAQALGALGAAATPALPALLELARGEKMSAREAAIRALAQIGPIRAEVVAALVERLGDEAPECRRAAADALAQMDSAAEGIVTRAWPALMTALRDSRESVRWSAGRALDALGAMGDDASLAAVVALLDDERGYVRASAARTLETLAGAHARALPAHVARLAIVREETCLVALGELGALGARAVAALPALARLAADPRWEIRRAALRALRQIAPAHDTTIKRSIACVNDAEPLVRLEALTALGAHNPRHDRRALEALQRRLRQDTEGFARAEAARALGRMGPRAGRALPLLAQALTDKDGETRRAAALAMGALQPDLARVIPLLIDMLSEAEPGPRSATALAMGALGPRAAPSLTKELLILLKDEFAVTRAAAAEALGHYGAETPAPAPQAVLQRLNDPDGEVRAAAAEALGQIGERPDGAAYDAPGLREALLMRADDQRYVVRRAAVAALTALGPAAVAGALDPLLALLTDANPATRAMTLTALATLDNAGRAAALPTLAAWLGAENADQRASAARALAVIHPTLDAADRDALSLLLTDADEAVRAAAAQAVGALSATSYSEGPPTELGSLLADSTWQARAAAAEALGRFGAQVSAADRRALQATLADRDETTRHAATLALAQIAPNGVKARVAELLTIARTRRPTGPLAALAYRSEAEVYAAMARPTWTVVERVTRWLGEGTSWATQYEALALLGRWRYAPMAARQQMLGLRERASYPVVQRAAQVALQAILTEAADLDQPISASLANTWPMVAPLPVSLPAPLPDGQPETVRARVTTPLEPEPDTLEPEPGDLEREPGEDDAPAIAVAVSANTTRPLPAADSDDSDDSDDDADDIGDSGAAPELPAQEIASGALPAVAAGATMAAALGAASAVSASAIQPQPTTSAVHRNALAGDHAADLAVTITHLGMAWRRAGGWWCFAL